MTSLAGTPGWLVAVVRPGDWDLALFVHVGGAMVLVGAAATWVGVAYASNAQPVAGWSRRLALRVALLATLPAFVVMRVGAEWIHGKEFGASGAAPSWVTFGYSAGDGGGVLLIVAIVLAWMAVRRGSPRLAREAAIIMGFAAIAWLVTVWVMAAKPA